MKTTTLFSAFSAAVLLSLSVAYAQTQKGGLPAVEKHAVFSDGLLPQTRADGWVEEFLERQAGGLTGHPAAMSYPYDSGIWNGRIERNTDTYGSEWWRYEQTAYYGDGLLRLGYLLDNEDFVRKVTEGVEYTLTHADERGRLGTWIDGGVDALWPMCVYFRVLKACYEKTGDPRIVEALHRHYLTYSEEDVETWRAIVSIEGMLWVYEKTGDRRLLEMSEKAWNSGRFNDLTPEVCGNDEKMFMHGVTFCEELKLPVLLYEYTGNRRYLELALNAQRKAERDDMLPDGVIASAEVMVGSANVINSHETCDIADYTWTLGYFLMATGESRWADKIEKAVFNACPGAVTKDFRALQYFSSVNQVVATGDSNHNGFFHGSTWMAYRPTHETECCAGNVHRIMPNYVSRMWMTRGRDSLSAVLYGPSEVEFKAANGAGCRIEEKTRYPFDGRIDFRFSMSRRARIPFSFRIPEWSASVSVELNGKPLSGDYRPGTFVTVDRKFRDGDCLSVDFGMKPECVRFKNQGVFFTRGPLVFSYAVPQKKTPDDRVYANMNGKIPGEPGFDCWSITPEGEWNYAWAGTGEGDIKVVMNPSADGYPFDPGESPVALEIPAAKIRWELEEDRYTPIMPKRVRRISCDIDTLRLVPYGSTELRVTVFPEIRQDGNCDAATICQTDAMFNVLPRTCVPVMPDDTLRAARGENAVAQFVIDARERLTGLSAEVDIAAETGDGETTEASGASSPAGLSAKKLSRSAVCGWTRFVRSSLHYKFGAPDSLLSPTGLFPDPIITDSTETVSAGGRALLAVDIPVTEDIAPGVYTGKVTVRGNGGCVRLERSFSLRVYPAVLPEQGLSITNWFFPDKFIFMNRGEDVEKYGPEYWECYKSLIKTAEAHGQNVWIIYETGAPVLKDGRLGFDFSDFDAQAEFLLANVNVRMLEGQHVATRSHNRWADPFWVEISLPDADGGKLESKRLPYDSPQVREYLSAYFKALDAHLKSRKLPDGRSWSDIYVQHIADEPVNENYRTWETLAAIAKEAAPGLRIIEAYRAETYNPELIDIIVPQLDELSWKSYETVPEGHQCWIYTCMYPRWNYANRYVTLPLMKTRLLHWLNFRYGCPGYLHWGFNYWGENGDPFGDVSAPVNDWPGGDAYIVYPGFRKVYPSIRLLAMRDGIRDYDLLRLVESRCQGKGRELVGRLILGYDSYDTSVADFREVRRQLLELASGIQTEDGGLSVGRSQEMQRADGQPSPGRFEIEDHGTYSVLRQEGGSELGFSPDSGLEIISQNGFAFKDHNHNGRLDRYEDWRLTPEERAADLASALPVEKIAGLMLYSMHQAVPTDSAGFWSSTYNGTTLNRSGLPHSALSDKQKKFLDEDNLRAVLVVRVESPGIAAEWNNNLQSFTEGLDFGIPVNISSDPRHETKAWAEFNAGAGGRISLWPTSIGLAATFDPEAVRRFGETASKEYRAMGIATALSPQIDLATEPRWNRFGGTFGEDPVLDADMARAYVDGFQTSSGDSEIAGGWGYESVNCMVKHWPGGGPEEGGRDAHYCYGKYCVYPGGDFARHQIPFLNGAFNLDGATGQASAVMPYYTISYGMDPSGRNVGNGFSRYIVGDLLREKYGYDGVVCTDWAITHDYHKVEEADGKCWGVELLTEAQRHYEALKAGVDQFGGNNDKGPVLEAYRMWAEEYGEESARARFEMSARRLLLNMFRTGLFENPYVSPSVAEKTVGCAGHMAEGYAVQKKSVVMLKNRGAVLPMTGRRKVYVPETSESGHMDLKIVEKYFDVADNAAEADFALAVIGEPQGGTGYSVEDRDAGGNGYVPISLQYGEYTASEAREHSIAGGDPLEPSSDRSYRGKTVTAANASDAQTVARTKAELGEKPLVTVVYATKPFVPAEIEPFSDALFVAFGVQYQAVLEILSGVCEPSAMLPMQLPADMETVERQDEDRYGDMECYRDSEGNLYDFAFGLNWSGRITDARYWKYRR